MCRLFHAGGTTRPFRDDLGAQPLVDPSLARGAAVVLLVNRARQLDEPLPKVAGALTVPDPVFDGALSVAGSSSPMRPPGGIIAICDMIS